MLEGGKKWIASIRLFFFLKKGWGCFPKMELNSFFNLFQAHPLVKALEGALWQKPHRARFELADHVKELGVRNEVPERCVTRVLPRPEESHQRLADQLCLSMKRKGRGPVNIKISNEKCKLPLSIMEKGGN
jgi:hypothetical protein